MTEDDIEAQERAEAEALAHALERGAARGELPEDALQTAALLRYSAGGGELAADREEAVLADVLADAERMAERRAAAPRPAAAPWWRWLLGFGTAAAVVALILVLAWPRAAVAPAELPAPDPSLVSAGLARLSDEAGDDAAYREALSGYRASVYGALGARYE